MASPSQGTWVWANSRRQWRTVKTGVLQSMSSQRVGHDWAAEQQQQQLWSWKKLLKSISNEKHTLVNHVIEDIELSFYLFLENVTELLSYEEVIKVEAAKKCWKEISQQHVREILIQMNIKLCHFLNFVFVNSWVAIFVISFLTVNKYSLLYL